MRKYSEKGWERRKEAREGFFEFFKKHVDLIKSNKLKCEECGEKLIGDVSEVAHILPKQRFKSISVNDRNVIYLCCKGSSNNCHSKFDDSLVDVVKNMNIYRIVKSRFLELKEEITEKINWKDIEKYE